MARGEAGEAAAIAHSGAAAAGTRAPLEAARARTLEGVALARTGDRDSWVAMLKQAAEELERFGAQPLRERALRELRRLGVRTWRRGATAARDAVGVEALSPREREVAALVSAGRRNLDIAQELSSAPRRSRATCAASTRSWAWPPASSSRRLRDERS